MRYKSKQGTAVPFSWQRNYATPKLIGKLIKFLWNTETNSVTWWRAPFLYGSLYSKPGRLQRVARTQNLSFGVSSHPLMWQLIIRRYAILHIAFFNIRIQGRFSDIPVNFRQLNIRPLWGSGFCVNHGRVHSAYHSVLLCFEMSDELLPRNHSVSEYRE